MINSNLEHGSDYKLISEAPYGSQLYRLFHRSLKQKNGFYLLKRRSIEEFYHCLEYIGSQDSFMFMNRLLLVYVLNIVKSFFNRAFFNDKIFYESVRYDILNFET